MLALALVACGQTIDATPDGGVGAIDAAPVPARRLERLGEPGRTLVFEEETELAVRLLDGDGLPLAGEAVRFVFDGRAHDSTLSSVDARTDAAGVATTGLVAGTTRAAFRVRASAEGADAVFFDVGVSDRGFGQLAVTLSYEGERTATTRGAGVFADTLCEDEVTTLGRGDRFRVQPPDGEPIGFVGLAAGVSYAVVGRLEGPEGDVLARGCVDGVEVEAEGRAEVEVALEDLPLTPRGSYAGEIHFEPGDTTALSVEQADALRELADETAATLMLDSIEAQLLAAGAVGAAEAVSDARTSDDLDGRWGEALAREGVGPAEGMKALAALLEERLQQVEVRGTLRVAEDETVSLLEGRVRVGAIDGELVSLDPARTGLEIEAARVDARVEDAGERLVIEALRLNLPLSWLVRAVVLEEAGEERTRRALLAEWGGCGDLPTDAVLEGRCDAVCLEAACAEVSTALLASLDAALMGLDALRGEVVLAGEVALEDASADLLVDTMDAVLEGAWTGEAATSPDRFDAELAATRIAPPP
ncbi:MAG: hypothetical protein CMN31_03430 [Sandaracinus sp.]|nr:hypothetical protein [Myxococcales bacterium]MAT26515.1 hypothetical protein [Sandaracinus sp.]MBJ70414.1 hypothetical protein [Sandaracinus sp.]